MLIMIHFLNHYNAIIFYANYSDIKGLDPRVIVEGIANYLSGNQQTVLQKIMLFSYGGAVKTQLENCLKAAIYKTPAVAVKVKREGKGLLSKVTAALLPTSEGMW